MILYQRISHIFSGASLQILILVGVLTLFSSCESESESVSGISSQSTEQSSRQCEKAFEAWGALSPTATIQDAKLLILKIYETSNSVQFAQWIELSFKESEAEKKKLLTLALILNMLDKDDLPHWYGSILTLELKEVLSVKLGAKVFQNKPQDKEGWLDRLPDKQGKVAYMLGYHIAHAQHQPNIAFNDFLNWGFKHGGLESFPKLEHYRTE